MGQHILGIHRFLLCIAPKMMLFLIFSCGLGHQRMFLHWFTRKTLEKTLENPRKTQKNLENPLTWVWFFLSPAAKGLSEGFSKGGSNVEISEAHAGGVFFF